MGKITFILGGVRSGKSNFAIDLAKKAGGRIAFIATCVTPDLEMKQRIAWHRKSRPKSWQTFTEGEDIAKLLREKGCRFDVVIIDCLTLLVSNLMLNGVTEKVINNRINQLLNTLNKNRTQAMIVSNEVGLGIVPDNKLARYFRDVAGRTNQLVAGKAHKVFFMVAGIPWRIK
ncbi:MAG: bifunctional adenosylcobinamide kinase/adenosylcobinamide-phosphate guanylyltransferase [Candidatus Margulisiibacteriota bacterium]